MINLFLAILWLVMAVINAILYRIGKRKFDLFQSVVNTFLSISYLFFVFK